MVTVLDASNIANNVFRGFGTRNLIIDGFTIRNRIPDQTNFLGRGMRFVDSSGVTVQNCNFDTTSAGMRFEFADPTLGGRIQVIHNTGVTGQGTDQTAAGFFRAAAPILPYNYPPVSSPPRQPKFFSKQHKIRPDRSAVAVFN